MIQVNRIYLIFNRLVTKKFLVDTSDKKDIVARQGTPCKKLYILLEGKLRVDIIPLIAVISF